MERIRLSGHHVAGFGVGAETLQLVKGTRYAGTLNLSWSESALATDALIAEKLTSAGFTNVTVDLPNKHVEGTWVRDNQTVTLPDQITAVQQISAPTGQLQQAAAATDVTLPPPSSVNQPPPPETPPELPPPSSAVQSPTPHLKPGLLGWIKANPGITIGAVAAGAVVLAYVARPRVIYAA